MPRIRIEANLLHQEMFGSNRAQIDPRSVSIGPRLEGESPIFYNQVADVASRLLNMNPLFGTSKFISATIADLIEDTSPKELARVVSNIAITYIPENSHPATAKSCEICVLVVEGN